MKYRFLILLSIINIILITKPVFALDEEIQNIVDDIDSAKEKFTNLDTSEIIEANKIDKAFGEIDKVTDFVKKSLSENNEQDAIKALDFIEKSLSGAASLSPQSFSSDMSNANFESFGDENMSVVNEITANLSISKEKKNSELLSNLIDLNEAGFNTFEVVENLSEIGVNTVDIEIAIAKQKEMSSWSKKEWANSWKGDVLTDDGSEIISDDEITSKVDGLEKKLQENSDAILNKQLTIVDLNNKINPINNQIKELKNQKTNLLSKYNNEILKQSTNLLSKEEINKSKKITQDLEVNVKKLTSKINSAQKKSSSLNIELENINVELANAIGAKTNLEKNIINLNNQLSDNQHLYSKKEIELESLKNTNLNSKINNLNSKIAQVSREKDFIESNFEKSIDLEVEALKRYHTALGNIDSKDYDKDIDFSLREIGVLMDADPRKHRAFEIEKFATYAGFSDNYIKKSMQAVNADDWDAQKKIYGEITKKLAKNPEWNVDIPTNSELNVMIEEDKAIQAAVLASLNVGEINERWSQKIQEEVKEIQPLSSLNISTLKYAAVSEGMREYGFITDEYDKLVSESNLVEATKNLTETNRDYTDYMSIDWQSSANLGKYDLGKALDLQRKYYEASSTVFDIEMQARKLARENVIEAVEQAQNKYNEIISKENPELSAVKKEVETILKNVPTFENEASNLAGFDAVSLRAKLVDLTNGSNNEYSALQAARDAMSKIGEKPVSEFMTGPYWEMTNVKAAAIVRSKKYDWVDDYDYINAYYEDPLNLNSTQRKEIENELKNVLGTNNIKLNELNSKISNFKSDLKLTEKQRKNLSVNITKIENELSSLKTSEKQIKDKIQDLSNQFNSKENLINEKQVKINNLEIKLDPVNSQISELENKRKEVNNQLNEQLNIISEKVENKSQVDLKNEDLKKQFESQIAKINNELNEYENQSNELNTQITTLSSDLSLLKTETPEISKKITKLNDELNNVIEIKADLAMAQAIQSGIKLNEKISSAVRKIENKSIVQLEGTKLVKVVSNELLSENISNLDENSSEINTKNLIVSEGVLSLEKTLSVNNVKENIDVQKTGINKISISENALNKIKSSSVASSLERLEKAQANLNNSSLSSNISSSISETNQSNTGTESLSKSLDKVATATKAASTQSSISTSNVEAGISAAKEKASATAASVSANEALAAAEAAAESSPDSAAAQKAVEEAKAASEAANVAAQAASQAQKDTHQAISEASVAAQAAAKEAQAAAAAAAEEAAQAAAAAAAEVAAAAAEEAAKAAAAAAADAAKEAAEAAQEAANAARSTAIDARISELQSAMEDWKNDPGMTQDKKDYWSNDAKNEINELQKEKSGL